MKKFCRALILLLIPVIFASAGCKKKEKPMVDMNTIQTDGSHDERYIFRKEIEKEKLRNDKKRKPEF